jgi:hypothetical protein
MITSRRDQLLRVRLAPACAVEASVIVVLGLVMLGVAMWRFAATE